MKKYLAATFIFVVFFLCGCSAEKNSEVVQNEAVEMKIKISVDKKIFNVTLENNETAREFIKRLPLEIKMVELNGNEKYFMFEKDFPTADEKIGEIHAGDLMIYNSNCLVLFYKNFPTIYTYTRLGKIDNTEVLSEIVGRGNITVKFEK